MTSCRRDVLASVDVQADTHAGLWLDKYMVDHSREDDGNSKTLLVYEVTEKIQTSDVYERFFIRWKNSLIKVCGAKNCREAETKGRLAVNLGAKGVLETSIALHRTYGVPCIPGSALKGLAAHYVTTYFRDDPAWDAESHRILFGDTTSAGYVTFYDALMVPGKGRLVPDVITVHHPEYYQGAGKPPADWDSPVPIPFITATGSFLIAISGPDDWVKAAFEILKLALEREGVGAKTSSGYGRMEIRLQLAPGYRSGRVKEFGLGENKSFGYITPDQPGPDVFVHVSSLPEGITTLNVGQHVSYKPAQGKKRGQTQATDVDLID
jgi:CRISPR-associated protein Cmr6